MCPQTFDYFIRQDVLEKKYYSDFLKVCAEKANLQYQLFRTDSLQQSTSTILAVTKNEGALTKKSLDLMTVKYNDQHRQNNWLKFGCVAVGVTGIVTTIYARIKKP